jgi:hypothetical protein
MNWVGVATDVNGLTTGEMRYSTTGIGEDISLVYPNRQQATGNSTECPLPAKVAAISDRLATEFSGKF